MFGLGFDEDMLRDAPTIQNRFKKTQPRKPWAIVSMFVAVMDVFADCFKAPREDRMCRDERSNSCCDLEAGQLVTFSGSLKVRVRGWPFFLYFFCILFFVFFNVKHRKKLVRY